MLKPCWQNTMLTVEDRLKAAGDEIERLTKQVSSYKLLTRSMEETKTFLLKKAEQNKEAVDTLGSEREANDVLTAENASLKAELAEAKKDAKRYLWIRDSGLVYLHVGLDDSGWCPSYDTDVDDAADEAMKGNNYNKT